jgi:hypothetical protein
MKEHLKTKNSYTALCCQVLGHSNVLSEGPYASPACSSNDSEHSDKMRVEDLWTDKEG